LGALKLAVQVYRGDKPLWEKLMRRGMAADFSWERSARAYLQVYENILKKKKLSSESR
jgi:starch synthase